MSSAERRAWELLESWYQLARDGAFGAEWADCEVACDCVVCETRDSLNAHDPAGVIRRVF